MDFLLSLRQITCNMAKDTLDIFSDVEPFHYIEILLYGKGPVYDAPEQMVTIYDSPVKTTDTAGTLLVFQDRYNDDKIPCFYKYNEYMNDLDLQDTIEGFGLDPDKFWLLIMFCLDYSYDVCFNGHCHPETIGKQISNILSLVNNKDNRSLTIKSGKKKIEISNNIVISKIIEWVKSGYDTEKSELDKELPIENADDIYKEKQLSDSVMIWLFATMIKSFLDLYSQNRKRKTKDNDVSLNKLSLISLLIYKTKLSRNKNFMVGDEALKGFLKQYKNKKLTSYSPLYS